MRRAAKNVLSPVGEDLMADVSRKLGRPVAGVAVLAVLVAALVLILAAAYHGSNSATASQCGSARGLLVRVGRDVNTPQVDALRRDDDEVNNFINGAQHADPGFTSRILRVADGLGRVVTDLQTPSGQTAADLAALNAATVDATRYCA